jgi:hypothetical protein
MVSISKAILQMCERRNLTSAFIKSVEMDIHVIT